MVDWNSYRKYFLYGWRPFFNLVQRPNFLLGHKNTSLDLIFITSWHFILGWSIIQSSLLLKDLCWVFEVGASLPEFWSRWIVFPFTACGILVLRTFMYIWKTWFMPRHSFYVYLTNSMNRASCLFCCKKAAERVDWFLHRPINICVRCFPLILRLAQILAESAVSSPRASASCSLPSSWRSSSSWWRKLWCSPCLSHIWADSPV